MDDSRETARAWVARGLRLVHPQPTPTRYLWKKKRVAPSFLSQNGGLLLTVVTLVIVRLPDNCVWLH